MSDTLSLQQIMQNAIQQGLETKNHANTLNCRFPVVVLPTTRAFLEAQSTALGQSLAGLSGSILDQVAAKTIGNDAGAILGTKPKELS